MERRRGFKSPLFTWHAALDPHRLILPSVTRAYPRLAADTEAADAITVLRVLVLKTFRPVLPCYVQLHHAHNRVQLHMLKKQRLVCVEDLKMAIMGVSALYVQ